SADHRCTRNGIRFLAKKSAEKPGFLRVIRTRTKMSDENDSNVTSTPAANSASSGEPRRIKIGSQRAGDAPASGGAASVGPASTSSPKPQSSPPRSASSDAKPRSAANGPAADSDDDASPSLEELSRIRSP